MSKLMLTMALCICFNTFVACGGNKTDVTQHLFMHSYNFCSVSSIKGFKLALCCTRLCCRHRLQKWKKLWFQVLAKSDIVSSSTSSSLFSCQLLAWNSFSPRGRAKISNKTEVLTEFFLWQEQRVYSTYPYSCLIQEFTLLGLMNYVHAAGLHAEM